MKFILIVFLNGNIDINIDNNTEMKLLLCLLLSITIALGCRKECDDLKTECARSYPDYLYESYLKRCNENCTKLFRSYAECCNQHHDENVFDDTYAGIGPELTKHCECYYPGKNVGSGYIYQESLMCCNNAWMSCDKKIYCTDDGACQHKYECRCAYNCN